MEKKKSYREGDQFFWTSMTIIVFVIIVLGAYAFACFMSGVPLW